MHTSCGGDIICRQTTIKQESGFKQTGSQGPNLVPTPSPGLGPYGQSRFKLYLILDTLYSGDITYRQITTKQESRFRLYLILEYLCSGNCCATAKTER